jgi:hypothetical protein
MGAPVPSSKPIAKEVEREPFALVRQYAVSPSPRIRRNAATALATLAESSPQAAYELVDMSLHEKDEHVGLHIITALANLPQSAREAVVEHTRDRFNSGSFAKRSAAYLLLVRLRTLGWTIPVPKFKGVTREMLMALTSDETVQGRRFRIALIAAVLICSLVSVLLAVIYVLSRINTIGGGSGYVVVTIGIAAAAAAVVVLVASRATVPAYLHLRRSIGNAVDTVIAFALAFLTWFVTMIVYVGITEFQGTALKTLAVAVLGAWTVGAAVGGVRAGTVLAHEMPPAGRRGFDSDWRKRLLRGWATRMFLAEIALGLIGGFAAVLGADALGRRFVTAPPLSETARLLDGSFWLALIVLLPCAIAFAMIDRPHFFLKWLAQDDMPAPTAPAEDTLAIGGRVFGGEVADRWTRSTRRVFEFAAIGLLIFLSDDLFSSERNVLGASRFSSAEQVETNLWMMSFPVRYDFVVGFLQPVTFDAADDPDLPLRAQLYETPTAAFGDDGLPVCSGDTDPNERVIFFSSRRLPQTDQMLGRGCYTLEITRAASTELGRTKAIRALLNAWSVYRSDHARSAQGERSKPSTPQPYELRIVSNVKKFRASANPFGEPLKGDDVAVGSWRVDTLPWETQVTVSAPMALEWAITPATPKITPHAESQGNAPTRREESEELQFSLLRADRLLDDDNKVADLDRVEPGNYILRVSSEKKTIGTPVTPVSLEVAAAGVTPPSTRELLPELPVLTPGMAVRSEPINGIWKFDTVPATFSFTVRTPSAMHAAVPEVMYRSVLFEEQGVDLELALESRGKEIDVSDDPEIMDRLLAPGDYVFHIRMHGAEATKLNVGALWLALRVKPQSAPTR